MYVCFLIESLTSFFVVFLSDVGMDPNLLTLTNKSPLLLAIENKQVSHILLSVDFLINKFFPFVSLFYNLAPYRGLFIGGMQMCS